MKIVRIATVPFFLYNHLREQIAAIAEAGHEVVLVSSGGEEVAWLKQIPGVRFHEIDIPRKISLMRDLRALWKLFLFFRRERFDVMHSTTPKAGMLCAIAAWLARVPIRLHTFTGQAWVELHGIVRSIAKAGDWVTSHLNTLCYADSFSQRDFIISERVCSESRISVPGAGSLAGVDLVRFDPEKWVGTREATRQALRLPPGSKVITFIGRITRDKGVEELRAAFSVLRERGLPCVLLLIGPEDAADGTLASRAGGGADPAIRYIGYSTEPERYLAITDLFCLPSYREGFGNVVIEAAAMGVPAVGTNIVGLRDAVADGQSGLLVPPKNTDALVNALTRLLTDDTLRRAMGNQARRRVVESFDARKVSAAVLAEYRRLQENLP